MLADYSRQHDMEIGLTGAGVLDPLTRAHDTRYDLGLLYNNESFSKNWGLDAQLRYDHLDYSSGDGFQERPAGYTDATGSYPDGVINQMRSAERRLNAEIGGLYSGFAEHALRIGAGKTWQDLYYVEQWVNSGTGPDGNPLPAGSTLVNLSDTPYAFAPEKIREINYLFLQDVWSISRNWQLTTGARYDHYSDFGDTLNPRLALVWQTTDRLTSKFMYGEAFRAPSYQELYAETSFTLPNPDLQPERSSTGEIAFSYTATRDLHLGFNLYYFHQTDLIRAVDVAGLSKRQFQNSGEHDIRGAELEAQWQATQALLFSANYSYREQDDNLYRAVDEPDHDAYLRMDWGFEPHWNWNVQANWIGERQRAYTDTRAPVDAYVVTDTTLRFSGLGRWEFAASVRNLMDVDAREYTGSAIPNDLPLPGRNLYAEMRYTF